MELMQNLDAGFRSFGYLDRLAATLAVEQLHMLENRLPTKRAHLQPKTGFRKYPAPATHGQILPLGA